MSERPQGPPPDDGALDAGFREWLETAGRAGDADVAAVRASVRALPARDSGSRRRRLLLAAAASIVVLVGLGGLVVGRLPASIVGARPPDPAAYAGDPRLAACRANLIDVGRAFEMTHARWYPLYFPAWGSGVPELEVDDPALVVLETPRQMPRGNNPRMTTASGAPPSAEATPSLGYGMCIAVGPPGDAIVHHYGPTRFERIVPVLSAADIALAERIDPDVLADPANWPAPERLAPCGGLTANVQYVFGASPIRDFGRHFPAVSDAAVAAFDSDQSATIVIFRGPSGLEIQSVSVFQNDVGGQRHDICVIFNEPGSGPEAVLVRDVDITGFRVRLDPPPEPSLLPTPGPSSTPEPAPSWVGDIAGQLECDDPLALIGDEVADDPSPDAFSPDHGAATAREALASFLGPTNMYASLPTDGLAELHAEGHWASFGHVVAGRPKAIIVLTDRTQYVPGWSVVGLRACDASEFDPDVPLTFAVTIWTDASGKRISTEIIRSHAGPGHCGWDSVTYLYVDGQLYFRDPESVMDWTTTTRFEPDTEVPRGAVDTGYRNGTIELWLDPGGDAYLVRPGAANDRSKRVERWPRSTDPQIGCA